MRERLQAWATYFAAVGMALWAAAGILFLLGNQPRERLIALLAVGVILFAIYIFARPSEVRAAVTSRGARYGSNALVMSIAFVGIIALLNFMGSRYHATEDLTANKTNTLSPLTVQVLKNLKEPVQALAFFTNSGSNNRQDVENTLREYAAQTDKFTYRFIDPEAEPQVANDYKVQFDGTIVMVRGTRRQNVTATDEQSLTNAIVQVSQDTQPTIYFTTGHGEHSPDDSGQNGYSAFKSALEQENYKVATLNLATITTTLPSDISALVIAGPRQAFDPSEVKLVQDYLNTKNGRVLVMLDPQTNTGLDDMLKTWGVIVQNDVVFDPKLGLSGQPQVPVFVNYGSHTITQDLTGIASFFPGARSLAETSPAPTNKTITALLTTSDASWGETDFASIQNQTAQYNQGTDIKGPLNIAYAVETTGSNKPARLVVVGNSSFISNGVVNTRLSAAGGQPVNTGNGQFMFNSLNWLAGQENLIAIPAKSPDQHPIFLTGEQTSFVFWSTFLMIPGAILVLGGLVWWRRR